MGKSSVFSTTRAGKVLAAAFVGMCAAVALSFMPGAATEAYADAPADSVAMHRLCHPGTQEHFFTADVNEKDTLAAGGWRYEGIGWYAPTTGDEVYRLYCPATTEHHYTTDANERDVLCGNGWNYEGVCWHSGGDVPLYRQYNQAAGCGAHNYTTDTNERDTLHGHGWKDEGIGWYGVAKGAPAAQPEATPAPAPAPGNGNGNGASNGNRPTVTTPGTDNTQPELQTVYVTKTGKKYHQAGCRHLIGSSIPISLADARAQGYQACRHCCFVIYV